MTYLLLLKQRYEDEQNNKIITNLLENLDQISEDIKMVSKNRIVLQKKFDLIIVAIFSFIFSTIAYIFIFLVIKNLRSFN